MAAASSPLLEERRVEVLVKQRRSEEGSAVATCGRPATKPALPALVGRLGRAGDVQVHSAATGWPDSTSRR
jgi:hypothetical protein